MKRIRVCVYPAQNECAVEINNALSNCEGIEVFGVTSIRGHNEFNFKNYCFDMPDMESDAFVNAFESFLVKNKIDIVFPTTDGTAVFFAEHQKEFSALITTSDLFSVSLINDKLKTFEFFKESSFCPTIYSSFSHFPCFVKPIDGEGAKGAKLIENENDIPSGIDLEKNVICEYLPGKEVTVDCLTDVQGKLVLVLPRERTRIFSGMCVKGITMDETEEIREIAEAINSKLSFKGLWFFQLKEDSSGKLKLLEISSRCGGTMCLSRAKGYNLPLLTVYTMLGKEVAAVNNGFNVFLDRTLFARYKVDLDYETVYVDYDGTIVVKDSVCLETIRFLYQCKNAGKRIILITRHNEDHDDTVFENMEKHGISKHLFEKIELLSFKQEKHSVITDKKSIFIDNSYSERLKVRENCGIPVFGVDGLDVLTDWRL